MAGFPRAPRWLAGVALSLPIICSASAATYFDQVQMAPDADILILASKLRHVTVAYANKGPMMKSCEVKLGSDARVIDQMMCSMVENCLIENWSGTSRMTQCVNARVNALEEGVGKRAFGASPFPDNWLAQGVEPVGAASDTAPTPEPTLAPVKPGRWVFTEMMIGINNAGPTSPSVLRWRKCIAPSQAANGLAKLLEPPPYTSGVRLSLPSACRDWKVKLSGKTISGAMACRTPEKASADGTLKGHVTEDEIVFRRERTWKKPGAWARASFDTSAKLEGPCTVEAPTPEPSAI